MPTLHTIQTASIATLSIASLLLGACSSVPADYDERNSPTTIYSTRPNGTGIHVGSTQPESWFGLTNTSATWFMNGLSRHADGTFWATGWYSLDAVLIPAEARVVSAQHNGMTRQVQDIRTSGSALSIDLRDLLGNVTTVQGASLVGLQLLLQVPDPTGLLSTSYRLRFSSASSVDSRFNDVNGYQIDYQQDTLLGGSWSSYCKGAGGTSQRAVFYQGAQWNPLNAARTDGDDLITMTCESGSVARCMSWGYRPWGTAQSAGGQATSLRDYHQACVHMKRASYCGNSQSNTIDGTLIEIADPFSPAINSSTSGVVEALWTPSGATCVSNRRHPELPFVGCPLPLPTCPSTASGGYLLKTALPGSGSALSLLD